MCNIAVLEVTRDSTKVNNAICVVLLGTNIFCVMCICTVYMPALCTFIFPVKNFLAANVGTLEAFHMKFQRQMLNIHWWDHITNTEVLQKTRKQACQQSAKSYSTVACLSSAMLHVWTPKSQQTRPCSWWWTLNSHKGRKPSTSWTRPPGHPRRTWLNLVQEDANAIPTFISMEN